MAVEDLKTPLIISGHLPTAAIEEFKPSAILDELLPQDMHVLFRSISPEFGAGAVRHRFTPESQCLEIKLDDIIPGFHITNLNPYEQWGLEQTTDAFVFRAMVKDLNVDVNELNELHPYVKFYKKGEYIVVEDTLYLTYGLPIMNILDRITAYIKTVKIISD